MKLEFKKAPKPEHIDTNDWLQWSWQLRKSLKSEEDFRQMFQLTPDEQAAFSGGAEIFNIRTTPYYASLAQSSKNPNDPLRRILMPSRLELQLGHQQMLDPLAEKQNNPAPRIIHRYPDRCLFLITDICSVYCRFCTRKHFTGQEQAFIKNEEYEAAIRYIRSHPGIREVLLSGGDPLTVSDAQLERVLHDLRGIDHVEIIRIGTRMPVVCPMRVTADLAKMIRKYKPVYMMVHFNHPRELTEEAAIALENLVDHGIPVMNQMVLLNGVNNHAHIVQALNRRLLYLRVKPYYMFQCDPSIGTDHLRTSVENSLEIQKELWGNLSGLAMPNLSIDIPDGGGKTYLVPNFQVEHEGSRRSFVGWDGVAADYVSPPNHQMMDPVDHIEYAEEWLQLKNAKRT